MKIHEKYKYNYNFRDLIIVYLHCLKRQQCSHKILRTFRRLISGSACPLQSFPCLFLFNNRHHRVALSHIEYIFYYIIKYDSTTRPTGPKVKLGLIV